MRLPFDGPADANLIIPELRNAIRAGSYAAEMIRRLPQALCPDDRVLVIGAGIGVVSTLVAKSGLAERVIAVEANTLLVPYLERVHALNEVTEIETVNAVLADGMKGRVPFFSRRDIRTSSLTPHDRAWQHVMMVPFMNLNLILAEEQISLIICDLPAASAKFLAPAQLDTVERILLGCGEECGDRIEAEALSAGLAERGYAVVAGRPEDDQTVLLRRGETH